MFSFNTLLLDVDKKPYIPASTLRGYLRSLSMDENTCAFLFGEARQASDAITQGQAGVVRVYDARLKTAGGDRAKISRTSIDAVSGTAKRHHLATHEAVPVGSVFNVEIMLEGNQRTPIREQDIATILSALQSLGEQASGQLGKGKSSGQGCLQWQTDNVLGLSDVDFCSWVGRPNATPLTDSFKPIPRDTLAALAVTGIRSGEWVVETFGLQPESPILINNPHDPDVLKKYSTDDAEDRKRLPNHAFMVRGKQALIPGSTLKGWFRAHCRRILLTLAQDASSQKADVDVLLKQLFGSTDGEGHVRFYDATVAFTEEDKHWQTFNAVDRFTGGVKDSALYKVRALWVKETFSGRIAYRKDKLTGWMQLLLLFAWRDAQEGDLVLGWGKSKGYGRVRLVSEDGGWKAWLAKLDDETLQQWENELLQQLGVMTQEQAA
jgi:CRISPR/Cas system CSM-associated protein Csm3 (group 7 of RAMP superfamily)